jgi:hypothetical protein
VVLVAGYLVRPFWRYDTLVVEVPDAAPAPVG